VYVLSRSVCGVVVMIVGGAVKQVGTVSKTGNSGTQLGDKVTVLGKSLLKPRLGGREKPQSLSEDVQGSLKLDPSLVLEA